MAQFPDSLVDKPRKVLRDVLGTIGVIALICVFGFYQDGATGKAVVSGLIALGALCGAGSIKVHYRLKGGVAVYE